MTAPLPPLLGDPFAAPTGPGYLRPWWLNVYDRANAELLAKRAETQKAEEAA